MPATVTVPALKPLEYQGRSYVRGDLVKATPVDAAVMASRGEVTLTRGVVIAPAPQREQQAMEADPPGAAPSRRRRSYRRSDMTARTEPSE